MTGGTLSDLYPNDEWDLGNPAFIFTTDFESIRQKPPFPAKYLAFETSGMTAEVKDGDNRFEFDLEP